MSMNTSYLTVKPDVGLVTVNVEPTMSYMFDITEPINSIFNRTFLQSIAKCSLEGKMAMRVEDIASRYLNNLLTVLKDIVHDTFFYNEPLHHANVLESKFTMAIVTTMEQCNLEYDHDLICMSTFENILLIQNELTRSMVPYLEDKRFTALLSWRLHKLHKPQVTIHALGNRISAVISYVDVTESTYMSV